MRKKELLFIMSALHGGGAEKVLIDYLKNFDYSKYKVTLCLVINKGIYLENVPKEVEVISLYNEMAIYPYRMEHWFSKFLGVTSFQKSRVQKLLKDKKYDVVISFMEGIPIKFHTYFLKYASKHISWIHSDMFANNYSTSCFKNQQEEKAIYAKMNDLVFVSQQAQLQFEKRYQVEANKNVVYNIIDKESILSSVSQNEKLNESDTIKICCVGRLEPEKRFDRIIEVARLLKNEKLNFEIQIIGDGSLKKELQKLIVENNVEDCVFLTGFVKEPYDLINQSHMLVSTSEVEGFSLVIAEALCLGKAIVTTNTSGPVELLSNGEFGVICKQNVDSLFVALKDLFLDKNKLNYYQEKALQRSSIFNVEQSIAAIEKIIEGA
jgi:glycosyltransferase involved in cell wall biosynthesis